MLIPNVWESISTVSTLILFTILVGIVSRKCNYTFKVLSLLFVLLFNIPLFGSIMNGLSEATDRWYYVILLFITMLGCETMEKERTSPKMIKVIFIIFGGVTLALNIYASGGNTVAILRNVGVLICVLLTVYIFDSSIRSKILLPFVCLLLIINEIIIFGPNEYGGYGYNWGFTSRGAVLDDMKKSIYDIQENEEFDRIDVYGASLGSSLVMDYYGTSEYFSILNSYVSEFYQELAISPGLRTASWILKGIDGREEIMSLLSVSQYIDFTTEGATVSSSIKKNEYYLPLGFTYDTWMKREAFNQLDSLQKQKALLEGVVLEEEVNEYKEIWGMEESKAIPYNLEYRDIEVDKNRLVTKSGSTIRVFVETDRDSLYISFQDFLVQNSGIHEILVGNKNLQLRNQYDAYYMGIDDFLVNVTELKEEGKLKYFDIYFLEDCEFYLKNIEVYDHTQSISTYRERIDNVLENVIWKNNEMKGRISIQNPKILFLSIPYSRGWKAYIGENKVEILQANVGFSAIEVPIGEHEIRFVYETPGIKVGAFCTISSVLLLIYLEWRDRNKKNRENILRY